MKQSKAIFQYQQWHLLAVIVLVAVMGVIIVNNPNATSGSLWGIDTAVWFWLAIAVPIVHQVYVWLVWRFELYRQTFTSHFGVRKAFYLYSIGFSLLFVGRLIAIIFVAVSNQGSLPISPIFAYGVAAIILPIVIYRGYSVKVYFTAERAYGIDHFDRSYDVPFVKKGIFKYTNNGMYIYGLMVLYLPGLLLLSTAALLAALFGHIYIWVHYYCTERPDMAFIYGDVPHRE